MARQEVLRSALTEHICHALVTAAPARSEARVLGTPGSSAERTPSRRSVARRLGRAAGLTVNSTETWPHFVERATASAMKRNRGASAYVALSRDPARRASTT